MSVIADRQALYGRLIDKGVENALARALSDALHETPSGLATEASVSELREETRNGFAAVRSEMREEFAAVRTETREEFAAVRAEIREGSAALRAEMREGDLKINARIDRLEARVDALPNAMLVRLGSLMVVLSGFIVTALHLWPPR